jgi:hypothetical protein
MRVQVALRMPNNTIAYQTFNGVQAHINARNFLQLLRGMYPVAEFPPDTYLWWQYVSPPLQPTASRAANLLL